jgi:hypothetical protein
MKIQGNAIRCRCASKERRAASQGEMNQNIVIPPSDLSNALLRWEIVPIRLADKTIQDGGSGSSRASATVAASPDSTSRGRHFYRLKCARLEVVPKEHATLPTSLDRAARRSKTCHRSVCSSGSDSFATSSESLSAGRQVDVRLDCLARINN